LSQKSIPVEQINQRQTADSPPGIEEEVPARNETAFSHFAIGWSGHNFPPEKKMLTDGTAFGVQSFKSRPVLLSLLLSFPARLRFVYNFQFLLQITKAFIEFVQFGLFNL
jgi:hypothetical protein